MKSRISFFNRTVFFKDCRLFAPISIVYFVILLLLIPVRLLYRFSMLANELGASEIKASHMYLTVATALNIPVHAILVFVVAAILAMALFGYMFNSKSANMIHSLPITRKELFGTNVIAGIIFIWIPQILTFFVTQLIFIIEEFSDVKILAVWLLCNMGMAVLAYGGAVFCAMLTGQMFAVPLYFFIANILYVGIRVIAYQIVNIFTVGRVAVFGEGAFLDWLSPFYYIITHVGFEQKYIGGADTIIGLNLEMGQVILYYFIFGVVLLAIAYLLYRRRPIEASGDFLTYSIFKPVFRWGAGLCGGFECVALIEEFNGNLLSRKSVLLFVVCVCICGIICFMVADMFIKKSFKVITKKNIIECLGLVILSSICFGLLYYQSDIITRKMPKSDNIKYAYVDFNFPVEYTGEEIDEVLNIQNEIIDNYWQLTDNRTYYGYYLIFTYVLENGKIQTWRYDLPATETVHDIISDSVICRKENEPSVIKKSILGDNLEMLAKVHGTGEIYFSNVSSHASGNLIIEEDKMPELIKAIEADIDQGCMNSVYISDPYYNELNDPEGEQEDEKGYYMFKLQYDITDPEAYSDVNLRMHGYTLNMLAEENSYNNYDNCKYYANAEYWYSDDDNKLTFYTTREIEITSECKNTIEFLKSIGLNIL